MLLTEFSSWAVLCEGHVVHRWFSDTYSFSNLLPFFISLVLKFLISSFPPCPLPSCLPSSHKYFLNSVAAHLQRCFCNKQRGHVQALQTRDPAELKASSQCHVSVMLFRCLHHNWLQTWKIPTEEPPSWAQSTHGMVLLTKHCSKSLCLRMVYDTSIDNWNEYLIMSQLLF